MKIAILVVSRNRPDLVRRQAAALARNTSLDYDLFVVEAGTDPDKLTEHTSAHYDDADFRGKCHAHNVALKLALEQAARTGTRYDYYWVLMNDVVFDEGVDAARILVDTMEREPRLAILSPTCKDRAYPASGRRAGGGWRAVTTCDYLGFMLRGSALEQVGFLNPVFKYCWGAIHELSHHLYRHGWIVAYSDDVEYEHLGGTTYGAPGTNTISRDEYQRRAKRFAYAYFRKVYGPGWARDFWAAAQGHGIEVDTYAQHEAYWREAFHPDELATLPVPAGRGAAPQRDASDLLRLHLGCGPDRRAGWTNVDVNPAFAPDLVAPAHALPMLDDASCAVIESCHLFEHLTQSQARAALREWRRLLAPGGELRLELPNLERCIALIGTEMDGHDLGLISLFGYPPEVDEQGEPQLHKWGWTPTTLAAELRAAGFEDVRQEPITQTFRKAAAYDRDMRLVARTPAPVAQPASPATCTAPADDRPAVLAWPRYDDAAELERFFHVFARVLSGRDDVVLCLRVDPARDRARDEVLAALEATHARVLGTATRLDVELLEGPLTPADWRALSERFLCRVRAGSDAPPRDAVREVAVPVVSSASALYELVSNGGSCGAGAARTTDGAAPEDSVIAPPGVTPDPQLVRRIAALQPWFYPVAIDDLMVVPGLGSVCAPEWLANRAACRSTLLVQGVLERVDMRGKSVLDLACNCAFWSSWYAQAGATRVFGVEGRERHVEQARLYWERGGFLPAGDFEFEQGNISDAACWAGIRARAPFDVTLCAGILYHIPNYAEVLRMAAAVTREVMIVDTRVQDGDETFVTEPGDLTFNAIAETRDKIVPNRAKLLETLRELGFEPQVLPVGFERQLGVDDVDCYADGSRVTVVARRVLAPLPRERDVETAGSVRAW
ncbi:MAG: hypothetical protein H6828_01070 [Planctomycetes bacterium]|nr:hypothetical protein [Planctomycetota bacterium]